MSKKLYIKLKDVYPSSWNYENNFCDTTLWKDEYPNIYLDHEITDDELSHAIDIIITYLQQKDRHTIIVDLDERNKNLAPAKEMTLEEIEKELGYKVKVVNKKEEK